MTIQRWRAWPGQCALLVCLIVSPAVAGADTDELGPRALRARSAFPWYDTESDSLQRLDVRPQEDDAWRKSRWVADGRPQGADHSGAVLAGFWRFMQALAVAVLAGLLAALIWMLVRAALRANQFGDDRKLPTTAQADAAVLEALPVSLPRAAGDLWARAQACFAAGDYAQAMIFAYAHQLVELDRRHFIHLSKGKTNRQYLRELTPHPRLRQLLHSSMLAFEAVFFGRHAMSREQCAGRWRDIEEFQRQLELGTR